jgi:diadenosine tetraphosphatase ApaH/serine/threonine PP2A family protein phosphatase
MTVLLLSDIHANLEALDAVLAQASGYDAAWFLGDVVGYGPDPEACVARLRELEPSRWLAGNHDLAAIGKMDVTDFNADAATAALWSGRQLSPASREWLSGLEPRSEVDLPPVTLVHGSPRHPVWEYVLDARVASDCFAHFTARLCFFGHTHVPSAFEEGLDGAARREAGSSLSVAGAGRWLINPGSVGQPRDGDPRASYGLYDPAADLVSVHRVEYDIAAVQARILAAGLPPRLARRLDFGW